MGTVELPILHISPSPPTSRPLTKGSRAFQVHGDSALHSALRSSEEHRLPSTHDAHKSNMFFYHNMTSPLSKEDSRSLGVLKGHSLCDPKISKEICTQREAFLISEAPTGLGQLSGRTGM